jgi:biopolymer transport protein ExbD
VTLAIKANGERFWNDNVVTTAPARAVHRVIVQKDPQPQVNVRADKDTKYGIINDTVQLLRRNGVRKVGFVSGPSTRPLRRGTKNGLSLPTPAARWPT